MKMYKYYYNESFEFKGRFIIFLPKFNVHVKKVHGNQKKKVFLYSLCTLEINEDLQGLAMYTK